MTMQTVRETVRSGRIARLVDQLNRATAHVLSRKRALQNACEVRDAIADRIRELQLEREGTE